MNSPLTDYWGCNGKTETRKYHHTLSILQIYALREGLARVVSETLEKSWERHLQANMRFNQGIEELKIKHFVLDPKNRLTATVTLQIPPGVKNVTDILKYSINK